MRPQSEQYRAAILGAFVLLSTPLLSQNVVTVPPPPTSLVAAFIADYSNTQDTIILFEEHGELFRYQRGKQNDRLNTLEHDRLASVRDTIRIETGGEVLRSSGKQYHRLT